MIWDHANNAPVIVAGFCNSFELFSACDLLVKLTKAEPLSCPLNIPDAFMDEAFVSNFCFFLADST
jgi:hypothetical protein